LDLVPDGRGRPVGYLFHLRGANNVQKSLAGLLRELLYQVVLQFPAYFTSCVESIYKQELHESTQGKIEWDVSLLKRCLLSLSELGPCTTRYRFLLFIDALDENAESSENREVLDLLNQLATVFTSTAGERQPGHILKICLANRPWTIFQHSLGGNSRIPSFAIHRFTLGDTKAYTTDNLTTAVVKNESQWSNQDLVHRLVNAVTQKAQGVFIWVRIVVENLCQIIIDGAGISLQHELDDYLRSLPEELEDLYRYTLKRIDTNYARDSCHVSYYALLSIAAVSRHAISRHRRMSLHPFSNGNRSFRK
jgi:hypothetical protein